MDRHPPVRHRAEAQDVLLACRERRGGRQGEVRRDTGEVRADVCSLSSWGIVRVCEADEVHGFVGVSCLVRGVLSLRVWYNRGTNLFLT